MVDDSTRVEDGLMGLCDGASADVVQVWAAKGDFAIEHRGRDDWQYPGRWLAELDRSWRVATRVLGGVLALQRP